TGVIGNTVAMRRIATSEAEETPGSGPAVWRPVVLLSSGVFDASSRFPASPAEKPGCRGRLAPVAPGDCQNNQEGGHSRAEPPCKISRDQLRTGARQALSRPARSQKNLPLRPALRPAQHSAPTRPLPTGTALNRPQKRDLQPLSFVLSSLTSRLLSLVLGK